MARKLLIDADVLVYETAFSAQKTKYHYLDMVFESADQAKAWCEANAKDYKKLRKDGKITTSIELMPEAVTRNILAQKLNSICMAAGSKDYLLILSGDGNFRDEVAVTKGYKANRADTPKPQHYLYVRSLVLGQGAEMTVGIEADDYMGIEMCRNKDAVICTIDKDLNGVPGKHYDWNKGLKYNVPVVDANWFFMRQLLLGDSTDNIPGLPGWGEKKADELLQPLRKDNKAAWAAVKAEYMKGPFKFRDGTKTNPDCAAYLLEQMQLIWMMRKPNERITPELFEQEYLNG